jgi:hypothetical protein
MHIDNTGRGVDWQVRGFPRDRSEKDIWDGQKDVAPISHAQQLPQLGTKLAKRRVVTRGPSKRLLALYNMGVQKIRKRNNIAQRVAMLRSQQNNMQNRVTLSAAQCNLDWYERLFNLSKERNALGVERRRKIAQKYLHHHHLYPPIQGCVTLIEHNRQNYKRRKNIDASSLCSTETTENERSEMSMSSSYCSNFNTENRDPNKSTEQDFSAYSVVNRIRSDRREFVYKNMDDCIVYGDSVDSDLSEDSKDHDPNSCGPLNWRDSDYSEESSARTCSSLGSNISKSSGSTSSNQLGTLENIARVRSSRKITSNWHPSLHKEISSRFTLLAKTSAQQRPSLQKSMCIRGPLPQKSTRTQHTSLQIHLTSDCSEERSNSSSDSRQPNDGERCDTDEFCYGFYNDGERRDVDNIYYDREISSDHHGYPSCCGSVMMCNLLGNTGSSQSDIFCYSSKATDYQVDKEELTYLIALLRNHDTIEGLKNPDCGPFRDPTTDGSLTVFDPDFTRIDCKVEGAIEIVFLTNQEYALKRQSY